MKKRNLTILFSLFLIFLLGLLLRLIYFNNATFGWDQARDAIQAMSIWKGDPIKIIGPSTAELPGLHHGPLYWYLISPVLYFTSGSIFATRFFLILFNLLNVFFIYFLAKKLFKNTYVALLSSFYFAISFEAIQYGRWLSNPSPALLTIGITFFGLWEMMHGKKYGIIFTLAAWALSIHFQFFLAYQAIFIVPTIIYLLKTKKLRLSWHTLAAALSFIFILLPFAAAEIKFGFQGVKALTGLVGEQEFLRSFTEIVFKFFDRIVFVFYLNVFGLNLVLAGVVALLVIGYSIVYIYKNNTYKNEFLLLLFWLLSPFFIVPFEKAYAYFITIGSLYPAIILSAFITTEIIRKYKFPRRSSFALIALILFFGQLNLVHSQNKMGETLFSVQKKMILSDELKLIDWIYLKSAGKPFVINTVTNPLFINTTWAYLFDSYGQKKYKYMPIWGGYPQDGQFGENIQFSTSSNFSSLSSFLIIEPGPGIPDAYIRATSRFENTRSVLMERKEFGGFIVERRTMINNNNFDRDKLFQIIKATEP